MNPEFRRNVWLQLTPERLIVLPAVLALVLVALSVFGRDAVIVASWYVAAVLGLMWGARLASASVLGEVAGRTWDWQRSSALTGWQMVWGKLFGATVYTWYGVGLALVAALVAAQVQPSTVQWLPEQPLAGIARDWIRLILSALFGQAVALMLALVLLSRGGEAGRANRLSAEVGGYVVGLAACVLAGSVAREDLVRQVDWFHWRPGNLVVELASLAFWAGWAVIGAWRLMARELQIPLRPWAWPAFVATASLWAAGLLPAAALLRDHISIQPSLPWERTLVEAALRCFVAVAVAALATWVGALIDAKSPVQLRRLQSALQQRRFDQALSIAPSWVLGLPVLAAAVAGYLLVWFLLRRPGMIESSPGGTFRLWQPPLAALSLILFLVRDIGLMYALAPDDGRKRRIPAVVYLAILYGVLPGVVISIGWHWLLVALIPLASAGAGSALGLAVLSLEAAAGMAMGAFALRRVLGPR